MKKHLKYIGDGHDKFWQIEVTGRSFTVTWGRNGTRGTSQTKTFSGERKCVETADALFRSKLAKGYVEYPITPGTSYTYKMVDIEETPDDFVACELV